MIARQLSKSLIRNVPRVSLRVNATSVSTCLILLIHSSLINSKRHSQNYHKDILV